MKTKATAIAITATMAIMGLISLVSKNDLMLRTHAAVSCVLLGCVSIFGVLQYYSQEYRDFREVYREDSKLKSQKIAKLEQELKNVRIEKSARQASLSSKPVVIDSALLISGGAELERDCKI
jgi:hypothetical protein